MNFEGFSPWYQKSVCWLTQGDIVTQDDRPHAWFSIKTSTTNLTSVERERHVKNTNSQVGCYSCATGFGSTQILGKVQHNFLQLFTQIQVLS
jgi:hypothetical protein